eukprot:9068465-Pyramimonas_sp.AAC.1
MSLGIGHWDVDIFDLNDSGSRCNSLFALERAGLAEKVGDDTFGSSHWRLTKHGASLLTVCEE